MSGQHWVEVPDTLTLDEGKYMIVEQRDTPAQPADVVSYEVQGSKGNTYTVSDNGGTWTCSCPVLVGDVNANMSRLRKMQVGDLVTYWYQRPRWRKGQSVHLGLIIETGKFTGNRDVKVLWTDQPNQKPK